MTGKYIFSFTSICDPFTVTPVLLFHWIKNVTFVSEIGNNGTFWLPYNTVDY